MKNLHIKNHTNFHVLNGNTHFCHFESCFMYVFFNLQKAIKNVFQELKKQIRKKEIKISQGKVVETFSLLSEIFYRNSEYKINAHYMKENSVKICRVFFLWNQR